MQQGHLPGQITEEDVSEFAFRPSSMPPKSLNLMHATQRDGAHRQKPARSTTALVRILRDLDTCAWPWHLRCRCPIGPLERASRADLSRGASVGGLLGQARAAGRHHAVQNL